MSSSRTTFLILAISAAGLLQAQGQRARITQRIDDSRITRLPRTTHPLAGRARDLGRAAADQPMERILLQFAMSAEQESDLDQLIAQQHDPSSPQYQRWLTPEEFGERFGPAQPDVEAVSRWLEQQGFRVDGVARGRRTMEISGTVGAVERAFHTQMRRMEWQGETHLANSMDISLPNALIGVVKGVVSLHDFRSRTQHHEPVPLANLGGGAHALSPYDFAAIYNVAPLWNQNFDGTGQSIAIAGRSNIRTSDVTSFRSMFGLPANPPQVILNGPDPGILGGNEEYEADLDVQWSGAVAKGAAVKFVVTKSTVSTDGIDLSSSYIVNNNIAPIVSVSFGACELFIGGNNFFYYSLWQQASAQGMSVFVSSGDAGAAGCDNAWGNSPAQFGYNSNGLGSSPFNVSVGGTQFNDASNPAAYWKSSADSKQASASGYIPESAWNESSNSPAASGGGFSMYWPTPAWQTGVGVPAVDPDGSGRHRRYLPDVSLAASGRVGYLVVRDGGVYVLAGTSGSAPAFAGLMAMVNQYTGRRNGNPNTRLYTLAAQWPAVFHDITSGTNAVPCQGGTTNCSASWGVGTTGFSAGTGYDLATGLGSVDGYAMAVNWNAPAPAPPVITGLNPNPLQPAQAMQPLAILGSGFAAGVTVTASYPGYSVTLPVNGLLAGRIATQITVGTTPRTWTIKVTNPSGLSATASLTVPDSPAVLTTLTPNPITVSSASQPLTINGSNFQPGSKVVLTSSGGTLTYDASKVTVASPRLLTLLVNVGTIARNWSVQVVNPSGVVSNTMTLVVQPVPVAPTVGSITPGSLKLSNVAQVLTIDGAGFASTGVRILLMSPGYAVLLPVEAVLSSTGSQLKVSMVPGTVARDYQLQVLNPGGIGSNLVSLTVH